MKSNFKLTCLFFFSIFMMVGCKDLVEPPISVYFYTLDRRVEIGQTVSFKNSTSGADSYFWDFGDGNTSTIENPTHSYKKKGNYIITLSASRRKQKEEYTSRIEVIPNLPYSETYISPFNFHINSSFTLNAVNDQEDNLKWEIVGEKEKLTSTQKSFTLSLTHSGEYIVKLSTSNERGAMVKIDTIVIFENHTKPNFSYYQRGGINIISKTNFSGSANNQHYFKFLNSQIDYSFDKFPAWAKISFANLNIWINENFVDNKAAGFHPSREWLAANSHDIDKYNGIEIENFSNFKAWTVINQPAMLLHQMAYYYHFNIMLNGFGNEMIAKGYSDAINSKKYESVDYNLGGKRKAQATVNAIEYFAELSEAYLARNDFYPFNRLNLSSFDYPSYTIMKNVWTLGLYDNPEPSTTVVNNGTTGSNGATGSSGLDFDGNKYCGLIKMGDDWQSKYKGPRGGCFYINKNKNKVYIDRSECNC